jgi:hypothetical protein
MSESDKHQLFGEIMRQFEPYYPTPEPFQVANVLIDWFYPEKGRKNPYTVKIIAAEWFRHVQTCLACGEPVPATPSTLEWALLELADLEVDAAASKYDPKGFRPARGKGVLDGTFGDLMRVTEWAEIYGQMYDLLAVNDDVVLASRMAAVSYYLRTGKIRSATAIRKKYDDRHRRKPDSPSYCYAASNVERAAVELSKSELKRRPEILQQYDEDMAAYNAACEKLNAEADPSRGAMIYNNLLSAIFGETST